MIGLRRLPPRSASLGWQLKGANIACQTSDSDIGSIPTAAVAAADIRLVSGGVARLPWHHRARRSAISSSLRAWALVIYDRISAAKIGELLRRNSEALRKSFNRLWVGRY